MTDPQLAPALWQIPGGFKTLLARAIRSHRAAERIPQPRDLNFEVGIGKCSIYKICLWLIGIIFHYLFWQSKKRHTFLPQLPVDYQQYLAKDIHIGDWRHIVLMSPLMVHMLSRVNRIFVDATFKVINWPIVLKVQHIKLLVTLYVTLFNILFYLDIDMLFNYNIFNFDIFDSLHPLILSLRWLVNHSASCSRCTDSLRSLARGNTSHWLSCSCPGGAKRIILRLINVGVPYRRIWNIFYCKCF